MYIKASVSSEAKYSYSVLSEFFKYISETNLLYCGSLYKLFYVSYKRYGGRADSAQIRAPPSILKIAINMNRPVPLIPIKDGLASFQQ
jgi:hypothetical protein